PALLGPLSFLWWGRPRIAGYDRLNLVDRLTAVYVRLLSRLGAMGVQWVQMDEPALAAQLPEAWLACFRRAYARLSEAQMSLMLAPEVLWPGNLRLACKLPVAGLHVQLDGAPDGLAGVLEHLPQDRELSVGILADDAGSLRADDQM